MSDNKHPIDTIETTDGVHVTPSVGQKGTSISGGTMPPTRKISIRITEKHYEMLELLVEHGEYTSVSEAIRVAIRKFLEEHKEQIENIVKLGKYR